ncbi:DNA mismatch repair protein MutL [Aequitasia blattaphilus]|uniref:DNA mismatch repair protein MutL n=1 Tax=Aequitasia blattaphilus TaxID=2949332 RepID=A0ABT1E779_9FIRM|nr:DNA mismatch repair endonuclease MutL [Aequitasia blattaphilus]MCP1101686.1 DNA mismatch repair endonuclease MutL [Aequitasia blattaphilus]MCR8614326.1 DNA mismatch repair endonuclease MutL [Aequitasia blattaphilus]
MNQINVLDQLTIDKIAAGEVVERPASIVKELLENAIDANASSIIVEINDGGISYIRIADNGEGISREDVRKAFLRHSTSKIRTEADLNSISSLGFRGEALSSISAVSQVEMVSKPKTQDFAIRYQIHGGVEVDFSETGAPNGTTFEIRQIFYNTPARRKFLKTAMTEAGHISEVISRLALSHPEVSFHFLNNNQTKLHTAGNGNLKDTIYHMYGREIATNLLPVSFDNGRISISGFAGKPEITKGNRSYETFFLNGRYIKNHIISKAIEDAYKDFTMLHRFPFVVLNIEVNKEAVDVNVHPTKMEVRFSNSSEIYDGIYEGISTALHEKELIPVVEPSVKPMIEKVPAYSTPVTSQPNIVKEEKPSPNLNYYLEEMKKRVSAYHEKPKEETPSVVPAVSPKDTPSAPVQLDLFEEKLLKRDVKTTYRLIGQAFETYWMIEKDEKLYIIDQHAAHERVLYEKIMMQLKEKDHTSQMIQPPIILQLSMKEADLLRKNLEAFERIGYEIEDFGQDAFTVRGVPGNLYSIAKKDLLMEMIDSLSDDFNQKLTPDILDEKIASMSCKAAVKGNVLLSKNEVDQLISELLELDNPYHCPHGRPTIVSMTKRDIEKMFKRII